MKEIMEIFRAEELSPETRIKVLKKMVNPLNYPLGANVYDEIIDELVKILRKQMRP